MDSKSPKLGSVGKIVPRTFKPYIELRLNLPKLGVMIV